LIEAAQIGLYEFAHKINKKYTNQRSAQDFDVKVIKKPVSEFYKNIFHNLHHSSQDN
jgi:hypothetical protein